MKKSIFLLLLLLLTGCSSRRCLINGNKKYVLENSCGKAELSAKLLRSTCIVITIRAIEGDFIINADSSILIENLNPEASMYRGYYRDKENINSGKILLKKGGKISNYTGIFFPIEGSDDSVAEFYRILNKTYIPSNNLIMCKDESLIKDTLWISRPLPRR